MCWLSVSLNKTFPSILPFNLKVKELKEEIATLTDNNRVLAVEKENSMLLEDRNLLQKQLVDFQDQYNKLESRYKKLQSECK